ncbi:MAG: tripartite tricarboxylate transporter permease [Minisyncoccales bacterium]
MLIEIALAIFLGILFGTITGLIPGIHINLIGGILTSSALGFFGFFLDIPLVIFISSMAITHTFVDFIPSVFLGCPDTDTELSVLPGHQLLKKGQGHQAVELASYGSLYAIIFLIIILIPSIYLISKTYHYVEQAIPFVLITVSFIIIFLEKKKISAAWVFLLTGFLGYISLNMIEISQPLLPLLTGLFGSSMLTISIKNKMEVPEQKISKCKKIPKKNPLIGAIIAAPICSFLPGIGSGQAAIVGNTISKTDTKGFLVLLGATNTLVMGFSFISLYIINKSRTGAAETINFILSGNLSLNILILILTSITIAGITAFFTTITISKFFSKRITKLNYTKLSLITLTILTAIVLLISDLTGLIIFILATITGIHSISFKVKKANMMGCLLLPTIIFYLF